MDAALDFAVVVPAFNEAPCIPRLVSALRALFEGQALRGEVLLVDDGSVDGTAEIALREARDFPQLRVLRHRRNLGKTEALLTAAAATRAPRLVLFDADLQHSPEEIPRFLAKLDEGYDMVTGNKVGDYAKHTSSRLYNRLSSLLFRVPVSDLNSMKAFRRDILDEVYLRHDWHRFFVVLAYARGYSVTELEIALHPRLHGVSKYSGRFRLVVGFLDLLSVAFFLSFSRRPLVFFGLTGMALAVLGGAVGLVTIALRVAEYLPPFGLRPLLYLVLLLETLGFLLFGFGFVIEAVAQQRAELDAIRRRLDEWEPPTRHG